MYLCVYVHKRKSQMLMTVRTGRIFILLSMSNTMWNVALSMYSFKSQGGRKSVSILENKTKLKKFLHIL